MRVVSFIRSNLTVGKGMSAFPKCRNTLLRMSARIRLKALRCVSWIQNAERPCRLSECHTCLSFVCVFMCFSVCVYVCVKQFGLLAAGLTDELRPLTG